MYLLYKYEDQNLDPQQVLGRRGAQSVIPVPKKQRQGIDHPSKQLASQADSVSSGFKRETLPQYIIRWRAI